MTSQMTPAGFSPARRARSTAASVWPVRSRTPPGLAFNGNTWPGWTRSRGADSGSTATWIVRARSAALIPVVIPSRASTETVNAVSYGDSFLAAIRSRPSLSQRSGVRARQIRPRPSLAMKLIASGVANCAASVRSPSFSRSSSSQTTTIRPARISSSASSMLANGLDTSQLLHVLGEHVHLQVDGPAGFGRAQRRALQGLGDQRDRERLVVDGAHRERHAVHGDRALLHHVAQQLGWRLERTARGEAVLTQVTHYGAAVDVPLHDVPAEPVGRAQRQLEVHFRAFTDLRQRGPPQRLVHDVGGEDPVGDRSGGQADAVDGDRIALAQLAGKRSLDVQAHAVTRALHGGDHAEIGDQPGEQRLPLP